MGWKNWSYWLKGGIVAVIISIILLIIPFLLFLFITVDGYIGTIFFYIYFISLRISIFPAFLMRFVQGASDSSAINVTMLIVIISLITWFVIGAIIGWIYGKIKLKR